MFKYNMPKINVLKKKKNVVLYFSPDDFENFDHFLDIFSKAIRKKYNYSILTRVLYLNTNMGNVSEWKMLGEQIGLNWNLIENSDVYTKDIHDTIKTRLKYSMESYDFNNLDLIGLQFILYRVSYSNIQLKINKFNIKSLGYHKDLINVGEAKTNFNKILPLSMDSKNFGVLLKKKIVDGKIDYITLLDGSNINFTDSINNYVLEKKDKFTKDINFYQKSVDDLKVIITTQPINSKCNLINIYNINGMKLNTMLDQIEDKGFSREIGKIKSYINNTGIYKKEITLDFDPIYPKKVTGYQAEMLHPDWRVGTMDIETYKESYNLSKVYAAGFYVDRHAETFYIKDDLNSDKVILNCLDKMLVEKYRGYIFYIHNFGRFDAIFILRILIKYNELYTKKYSYNLIFKDNVILSMSITSKVNKKSYTIKLVDSLNLLQSSLSNLCKTFNTDVVKSYFPYDFVNKNNLFYEGKKPEKKYYNNIDNKSYKEISENWNLQSETLKYLKNDLISLYKVIDKFKYNIFLNYHTHITKSLTISGLAMNIFLNKYYNNNIPLITKKSIYKDIKSSYYGGITEVYKPYGKNLYYYDVNSLYPYSALNPMPGLNCTYIDIINKNISECIDDMFGFYYCKIKTSPKYIGLLPTRGSEGIIMPLGNIEGWYFSEELKFAYKHGYSIEILSGYKFNKENNIFTKYVEEFYNIKSNTKNNIEKSIAKSLLNNLLGRFGLNINKQITKLLSEEEFTEVLQTREVNGVLHIGNKYLVTFLPEVSLNVCRSHNVDYKEALNNYIKYKNKDSFNQENLHDVSVAISSAVTSYSRIYMNQIKLNILNKGGSIYYTDTDSIVTDIKLDNVGEELGKFKLEYLIEEAYFISNKTYVLKTKNGDIISKSKGATNNLLTYKDYINLYLGKNINTKRNEVNKNYSIGSVTINIPKNITLSSDAYKKRVKIFNDKNLWVDTKPLYM
jgi:hypothetical protein